MRFFFLSMPDASTSQDSTRAVTGFAPARRLIPKNLLTRFARPWFSRTMTQRNSQPQILNITSFDVLPMLGARNAATLVLVLVLITVTTGAGVGFA